MFIIAFIMLFAFAAFSCLSVNKYKSLITLYLTALTVLMFIADVYLSKTASYRFLTNGDYQLYRIFANIKCYISNISRYYNIGFGFLMLVSMLISASFLKIRFRNIILLSLPILIFVILIDPRITRSVYILENTRLSGTPIIDIINIVSLVILHVYALSPSIVAGICCIRSHIYIKKHQLFNAFTILSVLECFFLWVFVYKTYSSLLFVNVSPAKLPIISSAQTNYSLSELIIVILMTLILFVLVIANPFKYYDYIRKRPGKMAAQEINNNLGMLLHTYKNAFWCITKQLQLVCNKLENQDTEKAYEYTEKTLAVASEQFENISNMLLIIKDKNIPFSRISLLKCMDEALGSLSVPDNINISFEHNESDIFIFGNSAHITEAFVNIILNAIDALNAADKPDKQIRITTMREDDLCLVTVYDNGCGIERKHLKKIFGLFYTTKAAKANNGIGLNYVRNVLNMHHCDIRIKSLVGQYTKVEIVFPVIK